MKNLTTILLAAVLLTSCGLASKTTYQLRPDNVMHVNRDSSVVIVKGNAAHFQARAAYKARRAQVVKN